MLSFTPCAIPQVTLWPPSPQQEKGAHGAYRV